MVVRQSPTTMSLTCIFAMLSLIGTVACSNDSQQVVQKNEDDNNDVDDEEPDTGPVAKDASEDVDATGRDAGKRDVVERDAADRDVASDTAARDGSLDGTGGEEMDVDDGSPGDEDGQSITWDTTEECDVENGPGDNPSCSEPSSCPAPDNSREPEVTCYNPQYTPAGNNVTLHFYGKYLVKEGGPPKEIAVRQAGSSGVGRTNGDITVHSDCHVSATLYLEGSFSGCGDRIEVRLVREQNVEQNGDTFQLEREASDWKEILLTQP